MLTLTSVSKRFGDFLAVDNVSLEIGPGEIVGVLGGNGAGKSTLFSLISGINTPSSGSVSLLGQNPRIPSVRRMIGVTPQGTGLDRKMKVDRFLEFISFHYGTSDGVADLIDEFHLTGFAKKPIGALSGGQQRLVAVASAFSADAPLTLLDEPTTGLDTSTRSSIWSAIRSRRRDNGSIMITSHYIEEIEHLCDRVIVIDKGRVIADSETGELSRASSSSIISLTGVTAEALGAVADACGLVSRDGSSAVIRSEDVKRDLEFLRSLDWPFADIRISAPTLEQAFLQMTRGE